MATTTIPTPPTTSSDRRPSRPVQRAGGVAALVTAATYLTGFAVLGAYLVPRGFLDAQGDPAASLALLLANQAVLYAWYLVLYLVGGAALVVLVQALHDRVRWSAPGLARAASAFGYIWAGLLLASGMISLVGQRAVVELAAGDSAAAAAAWFTVGVVRDALGGGIEIVGAVWVLLLGLAGLRTGAVGRGLSGLGVALGVLGAGTLVPGVAVAGPLFGVGLVVWFVWAGISLLRGTRPVA
jgi:hypothetical protein